MTGWALAVAGWAFFLAMVILLFGAASEARAAADRMRAQQDRNERRHQSETVAWKSELDGYRDQVWQAGEMLRKNRGES